MLTANQFQPMHPSPEKLRERLQTMPSDQVKSLMLAWFLEDALGLEQFSMWVETTQIDLDWGSITAELDFQPLSETEMVTQSLIALTEYQRSGQGIAHVEIAVWADSLGTDNELPCPQ